MLTLAYLRARTALAAAFAAVLAYAGAQHRAHRTVLVSRYGVAGARGVTFIEYALLAAIAVFISWLFRGQLTSVFNTLLSKLQGGINNNSSTS